MKQLRQTQVYNKLFYLTVLRQVWTKTEEIKPIWNSLDPTIGPKLLTLFLSTLLVKGVFSTFHPDRGYFVPSHSALSCSHFSKLFLSPTYVKRT